MDRARTVRAVAIAVAGVVLVAVLGGCTGGKDEKATAAASPARRGGTLRVGITKPASIDPQNAFEPAGQLVVQTMCDPLLAIDPKTGALKPAIVESWSVSDRGKKFNLRINKNARFSNGQRVTADDVRFSLSRIASAEYASNVSELMRPVKGFDFVHGDQKTDDNDRLTKLDGVHIIENRSIEIELEREDAEWIRVLTHPATSPVPRRVAEANLDSFSAQPVCVGPYRVEQPWKSGDAVLALVRSTNYRPINEARTGRGASWADRIEFHVKPDLAAEVASYRAGEVDVAEVPPDQLAAIRQELPTHVMDVPAPGIDYVGLPVNDPRLGRVAVRRALNAAIDRARVVSDVYGTARRPATGFISPALGANAASTHPCPALRAPTDGATARDLLARSGVDLTGAPVVLNFNDELGNRRLVEAIAQQWREHLGLQVELAPSPWESFAQTGTGSTGFNGAFRFSWAPPYASKDQYLAPLFSAGGVGEQNFSRWTDPVFDRVLQRNARSALEEVDRDLEYRRLENMVCAALPLLPIAFDYDQFLVRPETIAAASETPAAAGLGGLSLRDLYVKGS